MSKVAVMGYGTVGSGVVEVLLTNSELIAKRAGEAIEIKRVLDLRDFPGSPIEDKLTKDFNDIVNDDEIDIVVETMGGTTPAYQFVKGCLENGKSVCTSNKELVAKHGPELLALASSKNLNFLFEASVGGGIPIIRPLKQSLTADVIEEISGILNGTTNYILTKMCNEGSPFDVVLKEAQDLGYAERNPEADVEGYDACRKIAILTSMSYGKQVDYNDIYTEGITKITTEDFAYAKKLDAAIKLVGTGMMTDEGKVSAMVSPVLVSSKNPLYSVNDVFNGIYVRGNMLGDVLFYGAGAGKLPTASAVVSDIIDAVKHKGTSVMCLWSGEKQEMADFDSVKHSFLVRVKGDAAANEAAAKELFGDVEFIDAGIDGECGFIVKDMEEGTFAAAYDKLDGAITRIRLAF